ncbi:hypothetical protein J6590_015022 [Homalodisca vitripennis]|nr:hypothetical protein J6590_015022 [Homalodisca vitripennis]
MDDDEDDEEETQQELAGQQLKAIRPDDEFDAFGKYIAHKQRSLKGNQSLFARKLMNDVIYEGELEKLTKDYKVMISLSQQFNPQQLYPPLPNPPYFPQQSDQIFYSQMPYPQHHSSCPSNNIQRPNTPLKNCHTRYPETLKPNAANPTNIMPKSQNKPEQANSLQPNTQQPQSPQFETQQPTYSMNTTSPTVYPIRSMENNASTFFTIFLEYN